MSTSGTVTSTSGQSWRSGVAHLGSIEHPVAGERPRQHAGKTCANQKTTPVTSTVTPISAESEESYSRETAITDVARIRP